jgi:hypothetical protein
VTTPNFGEASYDAGRLLPRLMRHRFPRTGILSPELTVEDGPFTDVSLYFSRGLADAGVDFPDDWFLRARLADLPALCELLTREDVPDAVVVELKDLIGETGSSF